MPGVHSNVYSQIDDVYALDADEDDIIPTRLRLEWAQYRVVQRFIMVRWLLRVAFIEKGPFLKQSHFLQKQMTDCGSRKKTVSC